MLQSNLQAAPDRFPADFKLPPNLFLLDPDNARRLNGKSQILRLLRKEFFAFLSLTFLSGLFLLTVIQEFKPLVLNAQIQQCGTDAQGSVTAKRIVPGNGQDPDKCFIDYRYITSSGEVFNTEQAVSPQTFDALQAGDNIRVKYLPDNPTLSTLTVEAQYNRLTKGNFVVGSTSITGFMLALWALRYLSRTLWQENQFFLHGQLIQGHVLACHGNLEVLPQNLETQIKDIRLEGIFTIGISYTFHSPAGKIIKSLATRQRNDLCRSRLPTFGHPIAVLYLNDERHKLL